MKKGFMDLAANSIIPSFPGQTARWIAKEALAHDPTLSKSKDPEASLGNTLSKQVQTGREKRIRRVQMGGQYRYFPVSASASPQLNTNQPIVVQLVLSTQELASIANLVAVGKFDNRGAAIEWLVAEGTKANQQYLDKVAGILNEIDQLKKKILLTSA